MILSLAILAVPIFFFPIHDAFGIAKMAYLAILAAVGAYKLCRMEEVKIPYALPLLAYLVAVGLSAKNTINWYQYFLSVGSDITGITIMIFIANEKSISAYKLLRAVPVIALLFSGFAVGLALSPWPLYVGRPDWAWESTMGNTGFAAGMVAAMLPVVAWFAWKDKKAWLWVTLALMVVHLDGAMSRTPYLSLIAVGMAAVVIAALRGAKRSRVLVAWLLLVVATGILSAWFIERWESKAGSLDVRLIYWSGSWEIIKDHPVFGIGRGQMQVVALPYMAAQGDSGLWFVDHVHNDYIEILAEIGPVGFLGLMGIVLMALFRSLTETRWRLAVGLAFSTLLLNALTFFPLHTVSQMAYFWAYAGLIARET